MIKILIVEDDTNIAKMIESILLLGHYESEIIHDGKEAIEKITNDHHFDLILLDVMLPGADGFEVISAIRKHEIPVIFLTAMQDVSDKVRGLRLGAEDYIVKPFEAMELLARIEVVLRRVNKSANLYIYEDLQVDISKHEVKKAGEIIRLTPKEFEVLVYFLKNIDITISRERLLAEIWGFEFEGESRTIDIHIQQIRKKCGLQQRLVTIPKLGYRLESR